MSQASRLRVRSRQIVDADLERVTDLLKQGFPRRSRQYWGQALHRLASHPMPEGSPKYGYLFEAEYKPVGVVLLISSLERDGSIRCNVSSWSVSAEFRSQAPLLISHALRAKNVTYINISPASHVQPIIEVQGFIRYSSGQFVTPLVPSISGDRRVKMVHPSSAGDERFDLFDRDLLAAHAGYGCTSFWCVTSDGSYPFVFLPRTVKRCIPCAQLIYCREIENFIALARPIARYLARRGLLFALIDANGPIRKILGRYFDGVAPKYFKGPRQPRLGDLAYTEAAMFGM